MKLINKKGESCEILSFDYIETERVREFGQQTPILSQKAFVFTIRGSIDVGLGDSFFIQEGDEEPYEISIQSHPFSNGVSTITATRA